MPVNLSDRRFFELLAQRMQQSTMNSDSIDAMRKMVKTFHDCVDKPASISFEDFYITSSEGHVIRLRLYNQSSAVTPVIIYFPGCGFIYDLFEENHTIISKIAYYAGCKAVMLDYRLAPEHPYPAALQDAKSTCAYIIQHAKELRIDPNKIVLSGYSSGANLAAILTNQYRNHKEISIFHQFLISGAYDYTNSLHDYDIYAQEDKLLDPNSAELSFNLYCHNVRRQDPACSPYFEKDLSKLPPTTIMVGEYDGGRSQSEGYAKRLIEAGNDVDKIVLLGQTHGTILYRKACSDGEDPAVVAGKKMHDLITQKALVEQH